MGNSLHNKIYLGRRTDRVRMLLAGMAAGLGIFLLAFKASGKAVGKAFR